MKDVSKFDIYKYITPKMIISFLILLISFILTITGVIDKQVFKEIIFFLYMNN